MATPSLSHLLHASNLPDTHSQIDPPSNHSSKSTAGPISVLSPSSIVPVAPTTAPNLAPASTTPPAVLPAVPSATPAASLLPPVQSVDDVNPTQLPASRSHASNTSLYQCADCQRRYSRPEHLARHIQTHTLGKRFGCQVCGKLFARADLLKRHTLNHQSDNDSKKRRKTDPGAGRVSHACRPCATARVKCEEIKPCSRCRNRNLTCEYASSEAGSAAAMHLLHLSKSHSAATGSSTSNPNEQLPCYGPQHPQHNPDTPTVPLGLQSTVSGSSPVSTRNHANPEESQLPTPDTAMDQSNSEFNAPFTGGENVMDMARLPFSDFLRDVLYDTSLDASRIDQAPQGLAVLDFCDDSNLNLNDLDFDLLDHWNIDSLAPSAAQVQTPRADDSLDISAMRQKVVKIWGDSPWRWSPKTQDSGYREQGNLAVPAGDVISPQFRDANRRVDRVIKERLEPSGRDKILAIVLSTVKTSTILQRVASSFPSAEVFDALIHAFLASHMCSVSEFIHFPTFKLNQQWPEWLATVASAGAILTPIQTLRKLGYALQEAVRLTIPARFEDNNASIQDLGAVQAFVLVQDIGLWSGNKRKMEIAECHLLIPITMMRYRGKFQRSNYPVITVDPSDEGEVLQEKWRKWYELESWKRLVFHAYLRDAQVSMTTFTNTSMSYAELTLPLPEARELWFAKSAQEWKMHYLDRTAGHSKRPPSLGDLLRDINLLTQNLRRLDVQFSISIFLHGFWSLILEYRQLNAIHRNQAFSNSLGGNPGLLLTNRHQELCKQLQNFQSLTSDWASHPSLLSNQESLVLHLVQMNLHVSLDDLQLFGGKEGEDQARRIYPVLKRWAAAPDSRQALWNAGQIIRQAKMFPAGHLKDFYAVAVHHAALALWTYGVVNKAAMRQPISQVTPYEEVIYLDGNHTIAVGRWIASGIGKAVIRGPGTGSEGAAGGIDGNAGGMEANITEPRACAEVVQEVLRVNFSGDQDSLPAIVENLCHLVKQLGNAAWAVGLAST